MWKLIPQKLMPPTRIARYCCSILLYQCGLPRVGCIGCPITGTKSCQKAFALYPGYRQNYILAFERMLKERERRGEEAEELEHIHEKGKWPLADFWYGDT